MNALDTPQLVAIAAALGWASCLRLYAVLFFVGLAGTLGWVELPTGLLLLEHPLMLTASGLMLAAEFLADKIPGVDTLWDVLHTLLRIPAGAALAATSHFAPRHRSRLVLQDVLSTSCGSHTEST